MARQDKVATVAEIAERFRSSSAAVLTDYRGLSVAQLKELRRSLGDTVVFSVVKNTLTKRAAADAGVEGIDDLLVGPSAIAFVEGDAVEAAKGIKQVRQGQPRISSSRAATWTGRSSPPRTSTRSPIWNRARCCWPSSPGDEGEAVPGRRTVRCTAVPGRTAFGALQTKLEADPSAAASAAPESTEAPAAEAPMRHR
jgi:large subunit ribosomal protein L10